MQQPIIRRLRRWAMNVAMCVIIVIALTTSVCICGLSIWFVNGREISGQDLRLVATAGVTLPLAGIVGGCVVFLRMLKRRRSLLPSAACGAVSLFISSVSVMPAGVVIGFFVHPFLGILGDVGLIGFLLTHVALIAFGAYLVPMFMVPVCGRALQSALR